MTHEQVKSIIEFVYRNPVASWHKTSELAHAYLEAHPQKEPPHDLREMARAVIDEFRAKGPKHIKGFDMISAMIQFASEVAGEKDKRIKELEEQFESRIAKLKVKYHELDQDYEALKKMDIYDK